MSRLNNHPIIQAYNSWNKFGNDLEMTFDIEEPGRVVYRMPILDKHLATTRAAHGGSIAALADATLGVGALSKVCEDGKIVSTVEFKISYFHPANLGDIVIGTSFVLRKGRSLLFIEAELKNQEGVLIAKASGTFNAYPVERVL